MLFVTFFDKMNRELTVAFGENKQITSFLQNRLDKTAFWWFNIGNCIRKDNDGKCADFKCYRESTGGVSRYRRFWHSPSRVGLVKTKVSNETRKPPLQGVALFEAEE